MDGLLESFVKAETVIWTTPVYNFGMTALLKTFIERTLPLMYPYQVLSREDGLYHHPNRYPPVAGRKNLLFASCGFPDKDNFRVLTQHFEKLFGRSLDLCLFVSEGEILAVPALQKRAAPLLAEMTAAGAQWAATGSVDARRLAKLSAPLVPVNAWAEMVNNEWDAPGETPPTVGQARGERPYNPTAAATTPRITATDKAMQGHRFLRQMAAAFDPAKAGGLRAVLEFVFSDVHETYQMRIEEGRCTLTPGSSLKATTRIITTLETWKAISAGTLNGQKAMMDGLYRVEGDFGIMMRMGDGLGSPGGESAAAPERPSRFPVRDKAGNSII